MVGQIKVTGIMLGLAVKVAMAECSIGAGFFKNKKKADLFRNRKMRPRTPPPAFPTAVCRLESFFMRPKTSVRNFICNWRWILPPLRFHSCAAKNDLWFINPLPFISKAKHTTLCPPSKVYLKLVPPLMKIGVKAKCLLLCSPAQKQEESNTHRHEELQKDLVSLKPVKRYFLRHKTLG